MKSVLVKVVVASMAIGMAVFALAGTAGASHVKVEVLGSSQDPGGGPAAVQVRLRSADEGLPVANATVTLYADESFGGVTGRVELGQTLSDQDGVATVRFHPLSAGDHQIRVEYRTSGESQPEAATISITMPGITSQLYQSSAGIQIPGLNVWLLMALVATVWVILLSVALRVVAIAHDGEAAEAPRGRRADASAYQGGATTGR